MDIFNMFYRLGLVLLVELLLICITLLVFYVGPQTKCKKSIVWMSAILLFILAIS